MADRKTHPDEGRISRHTRVRESAFLIKALRGTDTDLWLVFGSARKKVRRAIRVLGGKLAY